MKIQFNFNSATTTVIFSGMAAVMMALESCRTDAGELPAAEEIYLERMHTMNM